jgi:hypothetical protein
MFRPRYMIVNFMIFMYVPFSVLCVLFLCKCVLHYCHRASTQLQLSISYHIISYHIISYHIKSYHISYHITSYIISYHITSIHIISNIFLLIFLSKITQKHCCYIYFIIQGDQKVSVHLMIKAQKHVNKFSTVSITYHDNVARIRDNK